MHALADCAKSAGSPRDKHGANYRFKVWRRSYQLENAGFKRAGGDPTGELDPKCPQGSADLVFNIDLFALQRPSVCEQHSDHLIDLALHVDNRVPAEAHAMGDRPGVAHCMGDRPGVAVRNSLDEAKLLPS